MKNEYKRFSSIDITMKHKADTQSLKSTRKIVKMGIKRQLRTNLDSFLRFFFT